MWEGHAVRTRDGADGGIGGDREKIGRLEGDVSDNAGVADIRRSAIAIRIRFRMRRYRLPNSPPM